MATQLDVAQDAAAAHSQPLRVLAFLKYGNDAAATRHRLAQYEPFLAANGVTVAHDYLLGDNYLGAIAHDGPKPWRSVARNYLRRLAILARRRDFDVAFVHAELFPGLPLDWLATAIGKPVVYDLDDALFHQHARSRFPDKLKPLWKGAHAICGNQYLADHIAPHARSATVIPTTVDTDLWRPREHANPRPIVGWIGSPSTWEYVEPLLPSIFQAVAKHDAIFRVIGGGARAKKHRWIDAQDWSADTEIAAVQGMDIGIMPLPDTNWARGKCGFKLIEYAACGLPVVASPVGVNPEIVTHGENGFLASKECEWTGALDTLLSDAALRSRMGGKGRSRVVERYSLRSQAPKVLEVIRRAAGESDRHRIAEAFFAKPGNYLGGNYRVVARASVVRELLGEHPRDILDLGCGNGLISAAVCAPGANATLVDSSEGMLFAARRAVPLPSARFRCADLHSFDEGPVFDTALCIGVLAHVDATDPVIASVARSLRKGGRCVVQLSDATSLTAKLHLACNRVRRLWSKATPRYRPTTLDDVRRSLEAHGLRVIDVRRHLLLLPGLGRLMGKALIPYDRAVRRNRWLSSFAPDVMILAEHG
ncbi:MAG: glycosyltransferase [Sphingomonas sp.]|uniref:methyltransferase domain-containing protein n=1 Tax=Sphingomonas sp. TaxID=28214 RepID=UPI001B2AE9AA|nr:methyltransferase domain-containing protein [Sphingomonas sp.]MBO9624178.1 glycosyltransferase [Sphingomonas sp.]